MAEVRVVRGGNLNCAFSVGYRTVDGSAKAGEDYVSTSGVLSFEMGQVEGKVKVRILDDNVYEPDESFSIVLENVKAKNNSQVTLVAADLSKVIPK